MIQKTVLQQIFPYEWHSIVDIVRDYFILENGLYLSKHEVHMLLNFSAMFGKQIVKFGFSRYTEIGCGFAIPSLTISKLGGRNVAAFDIDVIVTEYAKLIRTKCKSQIEIDCFDFSFSKGKINSSGVWIAEKPKSLNTNYDFETAIINYSINKHINLAVVPTISQYKDKTHSGYLDRCKEIVHRFIDLGYHVRNQKLCDFLPHQSIIASHQFKLFNNS